MVSSTKNNKQDLNVSPTYWLNLICIPNSRSFAKFKYIYFLIKICRLSEFVGVSGYFRWEEIDALSEPTSVDRSNSMNSFLAPKKQTKTKVILFDTHFYCQSFIEIPKTNNFCIMKENFTFYEVGLQQVSGCYRLFMW